MSNSNNNVDKKDKKMVKKLLKQKESLLEAKNCETNPDDRVPLFIQIDMIDRILSGTYHIPVYGAN